MKAIDEKSSELFLRAQKTIPGGVNSPVRAFKAVGGNPVFITKGVGSRITGVDGKQYIDFVMSWGPLIAGHAPSKVIDAVVRAAMDGTSFGAPTEKEILLAEKIVENVPAIEKVRLVNSGTEAVMSALRLARGFTGKDGIIKFEGCYHGHADHLLVKAGSGPATFGEPDSAGVPKSFSRHTYTCPYNDSKSVNKIFEKNKDIAAVIVEPIAGNMGVISPAPGYLKELKALCYKNDSLLIFDEVITGFRVSPGGAGRLYGVEPDIVCLGKIIGGGLPMGAFGGRDEIMQKLAPEGPVYQAGTLSGNPLAVSAGLAMLDILGEKDVYERLDYLGDMLGNGLKKAADENKIDVVINRVGSMLTMFFGKGAVNNFKDAKACNADLFKVFHGKMLVKGIYLAPSAFEATFVSLAHSEEDIQDAIDAAHKTFSEIK